MIKPNLVPNAILLYLISNLFFSNQNKKQKTKAVAKIQGLVRGVQFRTKTLPDLIWENEVKKRFS